ncbi:MAG: uroporphyrinogen decarboxylase/cobalamine-independent methonine synthase family protein [Phycisphaerales bacterium]
MTATPDSRCDRLLEQMHQHDGLAPVDLDRFWADDARAKADPFAPDCPQVPCGVMMAGEAVWDELGIPEDWTRYEFDLPYRAELHRRYNDLAERIVGRRLLNESPADPAMQYPKTKTLADIFEAAHKWDNWSWWLMEAAHNEEELKALLDRVEKRLENLHDFVLPPEWDAEKNRLTRWGVKPPLYRGQRGPVTFATSIFGPENLLYLILDHPELAGRLRDTIMRAMLGLGRVLDDEANWTSDSEFGRGFWFADDNCALLTPDMYEFFGYPVLKAIFERYAPRPGDTRYQHSDSDMGHLLPILGRLKLTGVNFGPKVWVEHIRPHLPEAVIEGVLAPFTFSRDDRAGIVNEFLRDFDQARGGKGLKFATAGSINNGSKLAGMRLIMSAIQHFGRYDQ